MSAVRLSFGSRAGGAGDYQQSNSNGFVSGGPYDSLEALTDALKSEIKGSEESTVPECTTVELSLAFNALVPLIRPSIGPYAEGEKRDLPDEFKRDIQDISDGSGVSRAEPVATAGSIVNIEDPSVRAIVQRAASRGLIQAVESADGFKYSFNNAWAAKDEEGSRFSYICQDSMQNKDRHANGFTRTLKHLKGEGERGPRKPTYDCKGSVSVKFSSGRQSVDVYYRHYAIHSTVAERKAAPRPPPRPKVPSAERAARPKETGGLLATLQAENVATSALAAMEPSLWRVRDEQSNAGRSLKRKRESGGPALQARVAHQPMSLMELLSQSDTANAPQPTPECEKAARLPARAAVAYELPSWQTPPPPLNRPGQELPYPPPYPPPNFNISRNQAHSTPTPRSSSSHPQAQGLFTTLKQATWTNKSTPQVGNGPIGRSSPVVFKTPVTVTSARYNSQGQPIPRARSSCNNCRARKLKCDEGQPCGACTKAHKTDCAYEGGPKHHFASTWGDVSQTPMVENGWKQSQRPGQSTPSRSGQYPSPSWQPPGSAEIEQAGFVSSSDYQAASTEQPPREESPDPWFPKR